MDGRVMLLKVKGESKCFVLADSRGGKVALGLDIIKL